VNTARQDDDPAQSLIGRSGEEGSALVLALLAVVLMTILGIVLLDVLRSSQLQVVASEGSIQAEAIAQRGLDDTLALIRGATVEGEKLEGYRARIEKVEKELTEETAEFINDYDEVITHRGKYQIEIMSDTVLANPEQSPKKAVTSPDYPYVRKLVIQSTGTIDSKPKTVVKKQMTVYVSTINPVFRYPVSSNGDMRLNGTPYVIGDILVKKGRLLIEDEAIFTGNGKNSRFGVKTELPALRGFIRVDGDGDETDGTPKYALTLTDSGTTTTQAKLDPNYFTANHFPLEDSSLDDDVDVYVSDYVEPKLVPPVDFNLTVGANNLDYVMTDYTGSMFYDGVWVTVQANVQVKPSTVTGQDNTGNVYIKNGVLTMVDSNSHLTMDGGSLYITQEDKYLVAADLKGKIDIDEDQFVSVQGNVTLNNGFEFPQGSMYIKGDLKVIGDIKLQGTVYVDGNVELKEMKSINKKETGNPDPIPLIIVATGEIVLGNNTNENNEEVRAFFYSEKSMKLYGVISKLNLIGGIHGEGGVELNAVRGNLNEGSGSTVNTYSGVWTGKIPEVQIGKPADSSRLQIYYDSNLYEKPPSGIPTTNKFNVFVKDIQYVK
jgi:cytoskeletal protein CcmA (bactofilin family)